MSSMDNGCYYSQGLNPGGPPIGHDSSFGGPVDLRKNVFLIQVFSYSLGTFTKQQCMI